MSFTRGFTVFVTLHPFSNQVVLEEVQLHTRVSFIRVFAVLLVPHLLSDQVVLQGASCS